MPALEQSILIIRERYKVRVKLPKLRIEKFSDDAKQYRAFRDASDLVANDRRIEVYIPEKLPYWGGIKVTGRVSTNKW